MMPEIASESPRGSPQSAEDLANKPDRRALASKKNTEAPCAVSKEQGRSSSSEWFDIPTSPSQRKRTSKRSSHYRERAIRSVESNPRSSAAQPGGLIPLLNRILVGSEAKASSRSRPNSSDTPRHRDKSATTRHRLRDDTGPTFKRPARHRTTVVQKRNDSLLKFNPSLLSVLSSLTKASDKSSGSGSTVTQQSYNRRESETSKTPTGLPRRRASEPEPTLETGLRAKPPNVLQYLVSAPPLQGHAGQSVMSSSSSSSSHYEPSVTGSSEPPDTPSSKSTFPSPASTRNGSVTELRRRLDPQCKTSSSPIRSGSRSPDSTIRSMRKQPSVSDVTEDEEEEEEDDEAGGGEDGFEPTALTEPEYNPRQRSTSRSSRSSHSSQRSNEQLRRREATMRQHIGRVNQAQHSHFVDPLYGRHPSSSLSPSLHSPQASHAYPTAIQQYQWPSPPALVPQPSIPPSTHDSFIHPDRPPAPDAPELTQRTVIGYEMLAQELASPTSPIEPIYRKFEYLNHRVLLHLQDELCELEEQLRTLDEIIAQTASPPAAANEPQRPSASRRAEAYRGAEIHYRRTLLLGRIFTKTEQYNRAISAYASTAQTAHAPTRTQLEIYQQWMAKHSPIAEPEARFLHSGPDLTIPGRHQASPLTPSPSDPPTNTTTINHTLTPYLPLPLLLPLLLSSLIPTLAGRLAVTALIALGAFLVVATTRLRLLLPLREWAVCGAAYVLVMGAVAGCIPAHGG